MKQSVIYGAREEVIEQVGLLTRRERGIGTLTVAILIIVIIVIAAGVYYYYSITPAAAKKSIGIVFDVGGRGDLSFNDMAALGADKAAQDFGLTEQFLQSAKSDDYITNLRTLASQPNPPIVIVAVGFLMTDAVNKTAREFPNQKFAIIDGFVPGLPNVISVLFKENEGSAVAGALAAFVADCYSKRGLGQYKVGNVLGIEIPVLWKFEIGYKWGVSWAENYSKTIGKPIQNIQVLWRYTNTFSDPATGKAEALTQFSQGAVVSYNVAGATGNGIFEAAKELAQQAGRSMGPPFGIGVDSDQDWIAPGYILASMMKRVDVGVYTVAKLALNGSFTDFAKSHNGILELGMKEGGIKLSDVNDVTQFLDIAVKAGRSINATDIVNRINAMRQAVTQNCGPVYQYADTLAQAIKNGQINVPLVTTKDAVDYWRSRYG